MCSLGILPKQKLDRWKLTKIMETKGYKFFHIIKIKWINMVAPSKVILEEFKTLLVKMAQDAIVNKSTTTNCELTCEVETILVLTSMMPMLQTLQGLNKYVQNHETFICDFVNNVKLFQVDLHNMHCGEEKKYNWVKA